MSSFCKQQQNKKKERNTTYFITKFLFPHPLSTYRFKNQNSNLLSRIRYGLMITYHEQVFKDKTEPKSLSYMVQDLRAPSRFLVQK